MNFTKHSELPQKIEPCPIIEATFDIRYQPNYPSEATVGVVYKSIKDDFDHFDKLPILELPESIRTQDSNLQYKPHYKFTKGNYIFQVGPKTSSLSVITEYTGWDIFFEQIKYHMKKLLDLEIIKELERVALRYINFFDFNIYDKSNLSICLRNKSLTHNNSNLLIELEEDHVKNILRVSNNAIVDGLEGSVIDIDTMYNNNLINFFISPNDIISELHNKEKILFFSLLEGDFLKQLQPQY